MIYTILFAELTRLPF